MNSVPRLIDAFLHQVACRPDAFALIAEKPDQSVQSLSWRQLSAVVAESADEISRRFASDLTVPRRIGHASDNTLADVVIALASMSLGAVEVPIDHRLGAEEISNRWHRVGGLWLDQKDRRHLTSLIDHLPDERRRLEIADRAKDIDAPSLILWTSGTTGKPQGVMLSQRNLGGNAKAKLAAVPQNPDDVRLTVLPLSHAYARTCDLGTWLLSGCTLAITLGYAGLQRLAPSVRPTLINSVPSLADRMLSEDPVDLGLDRLRLLGCGGAAMSEPAFHEWKRRGVTVIQGYGLTETSPVICSATPENASPGLVGGFASGWESQIREGQLYVRGSHNMLGYWQDEQTTSEKIDADGWLATGDLVQQDAATQQLRILGRVDDVIVLDNGRKIFPATIERAVEQVPRVCHAMLVNQGGLQLWIDADDDPHDPSIDQRVTQILQTNANCPGTTMHRFTPPLSEAAGELTAKGTIRRAQILKNRFSP